MFNQDSVKRLDDKAPLPRQLFPPKEGGHAGRVGEWESGRVSPAHIVSPNALPWSQGQQFVRRASRNRSRRIPRRHATPPLPLVSELVSEGWVNPCSWQLFG